LEIYQNEFTYDARTPESQMQIIIFGGDNTKNATLNAVRNGHCN